MKQEEKKLLLKDLSARLPYGVVVHTDYKDIKLDRNHRGFGVLYYEDYNEEAKKECGYDDTDFSIIISGCFYGHNIKPYLFPLSSMTEEQKKEYNSECNKDLKTLSESVLNRTYTKTRIETPLYYGIDWLNAHHFDYRGLIEKGLALNATDLNIY